MIWLRYCHIAPIKLAVFATFFAMSISPASAKYRTAPLPEGLVSSREAKVRGLYAEKAFGRPDFNETLTVLAEDCKNRRIEVRVEGRDLLWKGMRRIYRTRQQVAVVEDMPRLRVDTKACIAQITLVRDHLVSSISPESLQRAGWIETRPTCGTRRVRCTQETFEGIRVECVDLGDGLMGSTLCYSAQEDLSQGLIVGGSNYTDDGSGPDNSWGLTGVFPDIRIDPIVFRRD